MGRLCMVHGGVPLDGPKSEREQAVQNKTAWFRYGIVTLIAASFFGNQEDSNLAGPQGSVPR